MSRIVTRSTLLICFIAVLSSLVSVLQAAEPPDNAVISWSFDKDLGGWEAMEQIELNRSGGGSLVIRSLGKDPHFATDADAGSGWKQLLIRARFRGRHNAQVFWSVDDQRSFSEKQSHQFELRSRDLKWGLYSAYFHSDKPIRGLRIDPSHRKGQIEFDWIAIVDREPPRPTATPVKDLKLPEGFKAELLYSVPREVHGSWVNLTVDDKGRLITSDQYGKLYRVTPPAIGSKQKIKIEQINLEIGFAQGLLYAFDSLYVMVNGQGLDGRGSGFYRVLDTDGDDNFDTVKTLRKFSGGSEHGPHAVILSPDGKSLYLAAGNHTDLPKVEKSLVPRNWDEDQLLGRQWDARGHAAGRLAPGGWICRTDPEGKTFELVSIGFRNEYDIAFNADGELFTYDADMEWDVGAPWYRPTRVNHVTSGSEFGWRSGTGKWPSWYPDSLPSVVDIGPGSPTGIVFGSKAKFPAKYQRALFISDWSYGVIYAVSMEPDGSTYKGTAERFVSAAPLPVTDLIVNKHDGAMYFTIGGRRTQSGLYRVTYVGKEATEPAPLRHRKGKELRALRRGLESLHRAGASDAVERAWPHLTHADRNIRYAARVAIEHQPAAQWRRQALSAKGPAAIYASIALARSDKGAPRGKVLDNLNALDRAALDETQQLDMLRAYALTFIRLGEPTDAERAAALKRLEPAFPADSTRLNRELCMLLTYLESPEVVRKTLALLKAAATQEEQIHYAFSLRNLKSGWTMAARREYFQWFPAATMHRGGASFGGFLGNIRKEAVATLNADEKEALAKLISKPLDFGGPPVDPTPRKFVKKWSINELLPSLEARQGRRAFDNGRKMFAAAQCFKCHRFGGEGGSNGPDLTGVGRRFNSLNLLESLIEPSKVVSDQYQATNFRLADGRTVTGRVVNLNGNRLMVSANMLDPGNLTAINRGDIDEMAPSKVSMMPEGLLNTLTKEEVLDLIAYLRSGGDRKHPAFR